ncbi:MAG TPA: AraC family transcriptional regulator [Ramlibacter sp.]|nr:AraC family transcriptional regulator [Ramlibacter sp.]
MGTARDSLSLRAYGAAHGSHDHAYHQLLVGLTGVLELEVEGRGRRVAAGDAVLVPSGERHAFASTLGSNCLVLDTACQLWDGCGVVPHRPQQVAALAQYLAQAIHQPLAVAHAPALLLDAWRAPQRTQRPRRRIDWVELAAWVQARLADPVDVAELAQRVHLSTGQLALRCHEANGIGPLDWLRLQRLARARQLRDEDLPVHEVARRTGYRSPSALTAALRRSGL